MADTHHHHPHTTHAAHGRDMAAAFTGLVIGLVVVLVLVGTVVMLTNRHFANERPAAGAQH